MENDEKEAATRAALSGTTKELFQIWKQECLSGSFDRRQAKRFFQTLQNTTIQVSEQVVLSTKPSHEAALALLIQTLEECFVGGTNRQRYCGLVCMQGALQACHSLRLEMVDLLGAFLLNHAGPIVSDDINEDYDEQIRDLALQLFLLVVQVHAVPSDSSDAKAYVDQLLHLTQQIVERRCAQDDDAVDDYGYRQRPNLGLSVLPRSKRSLCFQVLAETVTKLSIVPLLQRYQAYDDDISVGWEGFCLFVISCLHGESDPRCLMQLLELFGNLAETFVILKDKFPVSELFDATAPYYPINFHPPPNDVHGITRQGLRRAVLTILSCTDYDVHKKNTDETMGRLSTRLILETLVPPPEDDPVSFSEQLETLEDLEGFLLTARKGKCNLELLQTAEIQHLSESLYVLHETASLAASNDMVAKRLAEQCRAVVAEVALKCETSPSQWRVFVQDCIGKLQLNSTASGRVAIAYLACLASCGGSKTLENCVKTGISSLMRQAGDPEERPNALFGIGALFSACRVTMEKATANGIHIRPHPLLSFGAKTLNMVFESLGRENAQSTRISAVRAIESILRASPATAFTEDHEAQTIESLRMILSCLTNTTDPDGMTDADRVDKKEVEACSVTLGGLLMSVLASDNDESSYSTLLDSDAIRSFLLNDVFSTLVESVQTAPVRADATRYDQKALSMASSASLQAASTIVGLLTDSLLSSITRDETDRSNTVANTLVFLFHQTGGYASQAYQELFKPATTVFDIVDALAPLSENDNGVEANFGMSGLQLPIPDEVGEANRATIVRASQLVGKLREAYGGAVDNHHFNQLVFAVDKVLPPLSSEESVRLGVILPLFSATMEKVCPEEASPRNENSPFTLVRTMGPSLLDYAMSSDSYIEARVHAGRCLHASIARFTPRNAQECPARNLVQSRLLPLILEAAKSNGAAMRDTGNDTIRMFSECMSLLALLGSAAACRGGPSARTSDCIVTFLVDLACTEKASLVFGDELQTEINLSVFDCVGVYEATRLSVRSASLIGSILSTQSGNFIWKQRLTHIATKKIVSLAESDDFSIGLLATVCQIACTSNLEGLPDETIQNLASIVLYGLKQSSLDAAKAMEPTVTELVLASLIKLLSTFPSILKKDLFPIITGSMRAYAGADRDVEQRTRLSCKLLALQVLEAVSAVNGARETVDTVKPAILAILESAMNDPCALLRRAAVEVRNSWCLV